MRLKQLSVKGLKSFADQTIINFNDNITGIVGPNGCGKSNIIDAIRWVLGEQKPSRLRVEKMEDLVFNGTKNRKPSGMAEVSLTFENTKNILPTEFQTVTIKRVLYRGGDSEYKINDVICRLKDIQNLFLDTGINSDSYAIIELGMVDDLLKDVDNSRRKIFEQASGISKYKVRKKETLNKLNATDSDLNRINDLLYEIETNLQQLEKQSKRTQQYYKLKALYKELSIQYALVAIKEFGSDSESMIKLEETEVDFKRKIEIEIHTLESTLEKQKTDTLNDEIDLSNVQREHNLKLDELRTAESQRAVLKQHITFIDEKKVAINQQNNRDTQLLKDNQNDTSHLADQINEEIKYLQIAEVELLKSIAVRNETEVDAKAKNELFIQLQNDYKITENQYITLEKNIAVSQSSKNNIIKNIHLRREEATTKKLEIETLKTKMNEAIGVKDESETALHSLKKIEESLQNDLIKLTQIIDEDRQLLNDENRRLTSTQTEYNVIKRMLESLEGYPDSIKYLKQTPNYKTLPMLGDVLACGVKYQTLVELLLENYLTYFVVTDIDTAVDAITMLHDQNKGRANFLITEAFEKITSIANHQGLEPLLQHIECDDKHQGLVDFLFANTYVVPDGWDIKLAQKNTTYISENGKLILRGNSLTGGASGVVKGSKLGKNKELETLTKTIERQVAAMEKIKTKLFANQEELNIKKQQTKSLEIQKANQQFTQANNLVLQLQTRIEQVQHFLSSFDVKFNELDEEILGLDEQITLMQQSYYDVQNNKNNKNIALQNANTAYKIASDYFNKMKDENNEKNIKFHQQENKVKQLQNNEQNKAAQQLQLTQNLATYQQQLDDMMQNYLEKEFELKTLLEQLQNLYADKEIKTKKLTAKEEIYHSGKAEIMALEKVLRESIKNKETTDLKLANLREKANEMKLQLTSVRERLSIEFNINLNDLLNNEALQKETIHISETEQKIKVEAAKKRLDTFGEFNPMAIEAFNEMKIRYDNIIMQKDDLEQAKNSLLLTIREIDTVAKENFMDAFVKIRENFIHVFRSLFTEEDQCDLLLENPSDPLDSPIHIIAKPKGKRPQNISQLSGGEKTLTATALLFSIYLIKPAPFCIFDEVDAPLDDSNIDKFAKIIKEFSVNSQFIVVTHNKQTMASVDVMYGVTMAEQGVSKLVPVDFRHLN